MKYIVALVELPGKWHQHIRHDERPPRRDRTDQHDNAQKQRNPEDRRRFETSLWRRGPRGSWCFHTFNELLKRTLVIAAKIHPFAVLKFLRQRHGFEDQQDDALI